MSKEISYTEFLDVLDIIAEDAVSFMHPAHVYPTSGFYNAELRRHAKRIAQGLGYSHDQAVEFARSVEDLHGLPDDLPSNGFHPNMELPL